MTIGDSIGLVYCKACGSLLYSNRKGRTSRADAYCVPVKVEPRSDDPVDEPYDGCDCTELCSMGPTCPGAILAGLDGSGCYRIHPDTPTTHDSAEAREAGE